MSTLATGTEVANCFISGDKIILRKPGDPEDVILRLNDDGTIDSPFGKLRKRASRAMNPVAPY